MAKLQTFVKIETRNSYLNDHITTLHPFNGLFSRTIMVSQHQKDKPFWILMKQGTTGWQWHQLVHVQQLILLPFR